MREKDIQDFIYDSYRCGILDRYGLSFAGSLYSELDLRSYGRADLVSFDFSSAFDEVLDNFALTLGVNIIEIKKGTLGVSALIQLSKYAVGIKNSYYIGQGALSVYINKDIADVSFSYTLIGKSVDDDLSLLLKLFPNVKVYIYESYNDVFIFNKYSGNKDERYLSNKIKLNI